MFAPYDLYPLIRFLTLITSLGLMIIFLYFIPITNNAFTKYGQRTMAVYLFSPVVILLCWEAGFYNYIDNEFKIIFVIIVWATGMAMIFNKHVNNFIKKVYYLGTK